MDIRLQTKLDHASWCREEAAKPTPKTESEEYWRGYNAALIEMAELDEEFVDEALNRRIETWHNIQSPYTLPSWLAMTDQEHAMWVERGTRGLVSRRPHPLQDMGPAERPA